MQAIPATQVPTLDVQVLEGLETYIATEQFLHKLEQAGAEWIDLSAHEHHSSPAQQHERGLEAAQVTKDPTSSTCDQSTAACRQTANTTAGTASSSYRANSHTTGFFGRWSRLPCVKSTSNKPCRTAPTAPSAAASSVGPEGAVEPALLAASAYELIEQQPPLHQDLAQQEAFVLVSAEDAIEGMAYYIALYLSRAPEAKHMDPRQLQAALKQTMTSIRRSRYRVVWDWGRMLYRWGAVSYSALQLYEHPWVVRALLCAIWTSSKMAVGLLV